MRIYIASSWKNKNTVRTVAEVLRSIGYQVDDFTDDSRGRFVFHYSEIPDIENQNAVSFLQQEKVLMAFQEDKKWLDWCDAVLLIMPAGRSAHLEAGYAKGNNKLLIIWGELPKGEFEVMYGFADLITEKFDDVLQFLANNSVRCGDCAVFDMPCPGRSLYNVTENSRQFFCRAYRRK